MNAMNGRLARTLAAATAAIMLLLAGGAISLAADPIVVWCEPQKQAQSRPSPLSGPRVSTGAEAVSVLETANKIQLGPWAGATFSAACRASWACWLPRASLLLSMLRCSICRSS